MPLGMDTDIMCEGWLDKFGYTVTPLMVSAIIWQEWSSAILGRVASRIMDAGPRPPQLTLIEKRMDDEIMDRTTTVFSCKSRPVQILKHLSTESVMDFSRPAVDEPE
jgi:hypothetical protein